jgi:hypothetical protein
MRRKAMTVILAMLCGVACINFACNSWENTTYQTLASAKATIDCASAGYNHNDAQITQYCVGATNPQALYLPQTAQVHDVLQKAGQAKDVAVNAMITYEAAKAAKGATDPAILQANVNTAVAALNANIVEIATLIKGGK